MSEYIRVRDYREQQILSMPNVEIFRESRLGADDVFEFEADHVCIATGADWRADRFDGKAYVSIGDGVLTADDIMNGRLPDGPTVVFDSDNYYLAGVIAERILQTGAPVTYVTESDSVSAWAGHTSERWRVRTHLMTMGVEIITAHALTGFDGGKATLACQYTAAEKTIEASGAVMVGQRRPRDQIYYDILARVEGDAANLPFSLKRIGDCEAPSIIAANVYAGHRYATELDTVIDRDQPLRHDRVDVGATLPPATGAQTKGTT